MKKKIVYALLFFYLQFQVVTFKLHAETNSAADPLQKNADTHAYKHYHALVVGIGKYDHWPQRPGADKDAWEVADVLKQAGFSVALAINPTSRQLRTALTAFKNKGQEAGSGLLLYYAGIGDTRSLPDGTQLGYIIPTDCPSRKKDPKGFEKNAISMRDIETLSMKIRARHVLMLFDASFSGDIFSIKTPVLKIIGKKTKLPMRQYIIAGKPDEPLPEKSLFQKYFLMGIKGNADLIYDGYITGSELGVFLANSVARATMEKQHPQYGLIRNSVLSAGDFVFRSVEENVMSDIGYLSVNTTPKNARIRILNIVPKFQDGMALDAGKYLLEASLQGYHTQTLWTKITPGEKKTIDFKLNKIVPVFINTLGMKFVYIKPGKFMMGSKRNQYRTAGDETPHRVNLTKGFYMQTTEVTVGQFRHFVKAAGYKTESEINGGCWVKSSGDRWKKKRASMWADPGSSDIPQTSVHPVSCVTWNDAMAFISWLSNKENKMYSLPTEAEWEYCCRAGTDSAFSFGNCIHMGQANFKGMGTEFAACRNIVNNGQLGPLPVGSLAANPWGVYDMHGNLAEWCKDRYGAYPATPAKNPAGPLRGMERVIRGGHWSSFANTCRSARRGSFRQNSASDVIGFRLIYRIN